MKNIFKSCVSLLLVLCMVVGFVPATMLTAHATETETQSEKETIVYASLGDSMTNGYCLFGYEGSSGGVNYGVETYANKFAAYLAGYDGAIANDQVIFEGDKAIVDHRPLAISGMRAQDIQWVLELEYTDDALMKAVFDMDYYDNQGWDASTWYDTWDFCGDYRTWADFCDFDFRYADAAAKILAMYNAKADTNGKYFLSSYADANAVENAKKGIAANPYYPEKEAQVGEIGDHKFLQIATEYFQESVTDADVISLAVGNTNFGTFMLTAIIDVVMSDDFGFDETYKIERVQAMAAADDFTKATVNAMIGSADYAEMRAACVALGGDDVAKQNQIGGIVDYCMTAYIVGYIGMLNQILELKFPAGSEDNATTSLDIIQVALMNAYDGGELKDEEGNVIPTMGDLVGLIYDPVNDMLKELPEKLMESKSDKDQERFAGVKFYFADVDSVECMVEVFGDDFYMDAENAFVKYPGLLTGTEEQQTYQANIGSVVRDRFVDEIVYGDMLFAKLGINIPDNQKATFYQNAVGYDMMAPKDKALFMINALSEAEAKAKAATEGADEATIAAAVKQATEAATDTVKSLALYLALENALIRAGTKNVTMHSLSNLGEIESAFGQETIAGMYAAIENAVKDPTKPYLMDTCKALAVVLEDTLEATLQSYKSNPDLSLDGDIEIAFDANIVIDPTLVKNLLMADMISDADQAAAARNTAATAIAHSAVKQIYVATVLLNVGKGLDTLFTTMGYGSKEGYYNYLAELEWAAEEHEEGEAYEPVETLDDAAMKKLAIAWADDASSETPYANLKSYINVINGLEPDSPASGMVVNMMLNAAGDKLELLNKFGTQLKTDEGVEAGMAEFAELTTIETTIANTINGNAALTMESAGQLASLLALPQTISDELINNTDIQGALTLNARCLLGTGAGGHPSAGGHNTLYDAIIAAYTDSCAQGHAYVEDGDEAWTWTEVEGGYTASVKLVCENNIEHTATVKADVQAEITDSTCTDVGKTVYTATAKVKKQTFTATKEVEIAVKKHDFDTAKLVFDEKSHWYKCKNCEAKTDEAEHKFTAAADKDSCTCGYNKNHVHSDPLTVVPAEPATCTEPGSKEYYKCDTCDTWFADKTGLVIISDHTSVVTPALKHNYKPAWAWAEDYSSATLTMVCQNDNSHTVNNLEVTVTPKNTPATCTDEGKTVYTATAEFEGQPVTDTKTVTIAPLKHSFTNYVPNKDEVCGKDGTKTATCDRDGCNETDTVNNDGSALEHIFENYVSNNDAACGKDGTKTAVCERANCDAKDTVADTGSALKHSFENYVSNNDATCEEDGTKTAVCERDGCNVTDTVVDQGSMLGHDYGAATYEWSADGKTCTATHICENDKSHVETAKATVTSTVKTPAECEEMGTTTYTAKFDVAWATTQTKDVKDIAALEHAYGVATYEWSADGKTCTATHICENDKSHVETAKATVTSAVKTAATCEDDGTTTYTAKFNVAWADEQTKDVVDIDAIGHDYAAAWTWAEDNTAKLTLTCKNDKTHVEEPKVTITPVTTDATCDKDGKTVYTATAEFEGESYTNTKEVTIPAGHKFGEWTTEGNVTKRICSACGYAESKVTTTGGNVEVEVPEQDKDLTLYVEHVAEETDERYVLVEESFKDSATEAGVEVTVLKVFDITLEDENGVHHQPDGKLKIKLPLDWDKAGNYKVYRVNDDGSLVDMKAVRQGSHMVFETDHLSLYIIIEETEHVHELTLVPAVAATCTDDGNKAYYTCAGCENWYENEDGTSKIADKNSVVIAALGHDWKDATCTEPKTCARCGATEGEAKGHDYQNGTCGNCGEKDPNAQQPSKPSKPSWTDFFSKWFGNWWDKDEEKCDHSYKSVVTDPTCTEKGYTTHTCSKCGDSYKDSYVNATGHDYKDGVCDDCGAKDPNANKPSTPSKPSWNLSDIICKWFGSWWGKK